jgi:tetratricopeptide (TPR) repeat protein
LYRELLMIEGGARGRASRLHARKYDIRGRSGQQEDTSLQARTDRACLLLIALLALFWASSLEGAAYLRFALASSALLVHFLWRLSAGLSGTPSSPLFAATIVFLLINGDPLLSAGHAERAALPAAGFLAGSGALVLASAVLRLIRRPVDVTWKALVLRPADGLFATVVVVLAAWGATRQDELITHLVRGGLCIIAWVTFRRSMAWGTRVKSHGRLDEAALSIVAAAIVLGGLAGVGVARIHSVWQTLGEARSELSLGRTDEASRLYAAAQPENEELQVDHLRVSAWPSLLQLAVAGDFDLDEFEAAVLSRDSRLRKRVEIGGYRMLGDLDGLIEGLFVLQDLERLVRLQEEYLLTIDRDPPAHHRGVRDLDLHSGDVEWALGHPRKAAIYYRRYLTAIGGNAYARYRLGRALLEEGRSDEALEHLEAAFRLHPGGTDAQYWVGVCHRRLGDVGAAAAAFRRVVGETPTHRPALEELWQFDGDEAWAERLLALTPDIELPLKMNETMTLLGHDALPASIDVDEPFVLVAYWGLTRQLASTEVQRVRITLDYKDEGTGVLYRQSLGSPISDRPVDTWVEGEVVVATYSLKFASTAGVALKDGVSLSGHWQAGLRPDGGALILRIDVEARPERGNFRRRPWWPVIPIGAVRLGGRDVSVIHSVSRL